MQDAAPMLPPGERPPYGGRLRMVWHLGFQKSGTTSFQEMNRLNDETLRWYCAVFQKRARTRGLCEATLAWLENPKPIRRQRLDDELALIAAKARRWGQKAVLISDENLIGWENFNDTGHVFEAAARLIPVIEAALPDEDHHFIFYTRDFQAWLASAYNQVVKFSFETRSWEEWQAAIPFECDWDVHTARIGAVAKAPVEFRDMLADRAEGMALGGRVLELLAIPREVIDGLALPKRQNESLGPGALEFMRRMNGLEILRRCHKEVRQVVFAHPELFSADAKGGEP